MHKILSVCFLLLVKILASQSPQKISYQGVARNSSGAVLSNTSIAVKFDIHRNTPQGTIVFTEQHQGSAALNTNAFGLFTTAIGSINSMAAVDWANGPFFIEVSIDPANGTDYNSVGTQELMSVPYALYAEKAGNVASTPTISINAPNTVTNTATGSYSIHVPSSTVYSAGSGIAINAGVISSTVSVPTPTITGGGQASVTSPSANSYVINVPTPTLSVSGNSISINSGNTQLLPENTFSAGNTNLVITKVGNDYTLTPVIPTLSVTGGSLMGSYPSQTLTIPSSSTTLAAGNNNITLNQSGNAYTITPVTPTLNVTGGSLTGTYPSQTLTIPSSSTALAAGNSNITLSQSGNAYTITPVTPTLNVTGGNLTGSYPSQTLTIPSSSTTLVQGTNIMLNQSGNTYTISSVSPTLTAGSNVTITPAGPANAYTISAGTTSYTGTAGNIEVSGNAINLSTTGVTAGTYGSAATNGVPVFSVDNFGRVSSATQYTPTLFGDVTGNLNASVVSRIRGISVSATAPTNGQVLQYTGSSWAPTTVATPWSLTGNAGTTASHFIGTTDNAPLRIRTNNSVKAVFSESGQFLLGTTGVTGANSKLVVADGHIESTQASAPSIAGAGTLLGLLGSTASLLSNATDVCGTISISIGLLGGGKGTYAAITFDKAYANPPIVILTPRSEEAAGLRAYVTGTSTTGFTLAFSTGTAGLTTYEFNYMILAN